MYSWACLLTDSSTQIDPWSSNNFKQKTFVYWPKLSQKLSLQWLQDANESISLITSLVLQ